MEWQRYPSLKQDKSRSTEHKASSRASNKSDDTYQDIQSGYDSEDDDTHKNVYRNREYYADKRRETRNDSRNQKSKEDQEEVDQRKSRGSSSIRAKTHQDDTDGEEESNEVLKLRRFCQVCVLPTHLQKEGATKSRYAHSLDRQTKLPFSLQGFQHSCAR
jgi:hypothetical protein